MHERSVENDFLLLTLRRLLPKGGGGGGGGGSGGEGGGGAGFNLCLMSATMDGDVLSDYFRTGLGAAVPRVAFPGRTFPVTALYLEDVLRLTGHRANPLVLPLWESLPLVSGDLGPCGLSCSKHAHTSANRYHHAIRIFYMLYWFFTSLHFIKASMWRLVWCRVL